MGDTDGAEELTIDELAAAVGTTTRRVRSLQTLGLVPHPVLRGRTGHYGPAHRERLAAVLRLQDDGFSLESVGVLFRALEAGASLAEVLGVAGPSTGLVGPRADRGTVVVSDEAELYGFSELQGRGGRRRSHAARRPPLSVVPTTVWNESEAS